MAARILWSHLFPSPSELLQPSSIHTTSTTSCTSAPPRLGIDFVKASAPETSISLPGEDVADEEGSCGTNSTTLRIQQSLNQYGIAGVVWNCARALIFYFEQQPHLLAKKRVVELGAGTGAVGLALVLLQSNGGAEELEALVLTDLDTVVPLTTQNLHLAAHDHARVRDMLFRNAIATRAYCWGDDVSSTSLLEFADVVLCSDCLYEPSLYSNLLASLLALSSSRSPPHREKVGKQQQDESTGSSPIIFIAYKQRIPERERAFFESASEFFEISVEIVDGTTCAAIGSDTIYICKLTRLLRAGMS